MIRPLGLMVLGMMLAAPARAGSGPTVPCLTCPRPVPACWMVIYRWTDYNLRSGPGNYMLVTPGPPPTTRDLAQALDDIRRPMPKGMSAEMLGNNRIDCPEAVKALARRP